MEPALGSWQSDSRLLPERGGVLVMFTVPALEEFLWEAFEISSAVTPVK